MLLVILGMMVLPGILAMIVVKLPGLIKPCITIGDPIVYRKPKASTHPGMRAYDIHANERGDLYNYLVDKYWTVADILGDGQIVAVTRTSKHHYINPNDTNLRKARLTERLRHGNRFPHMAG